MRDIALYFQTKLFSNAPSFLKPIFAITPFDVQKSLLLRTLHAVFKDALQDGDFQFLNEKWLKISILDLEVSWLITCQNNTLSIAPKHSTIRENVSFSATGDDLLLIAARKEDPDTLFFQRRLQIEGDTELGLEVKNIIDGLELEQLPRPIQKSVDFIASIIASNKDG